MESLSSSDRLILEVSRMLREDFLFQDAFSPDDAYTPLNRQYGILKSIITFYEAGKDVVTQPDFEFAKFTALPSVAEVPTLKDKLDWEISDYEKFQTQVKEEINSLA